MTVASGNSSTISAGLVVGGNFYLAGNANIGTGATVGNKRSAHNG